MGIRISLPARFHQPGLTYQTPAPWTHIITKLLLPLDSNASGLSPVPILTPLTLCTAQALY